MYALFVFPVWLTVKLTYVIGQLHHTIQRGSHIRCANRHSSSHIFPPRVSVGPAYGYERSSRGPWKSNICGARLLSDWIGSSAWFPHCGYAPFFFLSLLLHLRSPFLLPNVQPALSRTAQLTYQYRNRNHISRGWLRIRPSFARYFFRPRRSGFSPLRHNCCHRNGRQSSLKPPHLQSVQLGYGSRRHLERNVFYLSRSNDPHYRYTSVHYSSAETRGGCSWLALVVRL